MLTDGVCARQIGSGGQDSNCVKDVLSTLSICDLTDGHIIVATKMLQETGVRQ